MNYSNSKECGVECAETAYKEKEGGCCWLKTGEGCVWVPGSHAINGGTGVAINCTYGKNNIWCLILSMRLFSFIKTNIKKRNL